MGNDLANAIRATAMRLGIDPVDLGTAISYETAGTFDPWKAGPTTKWGQHRGLIQMGEPQRAEFGYHEGDSLDAQMRAAEKYLLKTGVKPGMGLMDLYSAVNAGSVGRYGASDAAAGGAPGTVADKVNNQMAGHHAKALALLSGQLPLAGSPFAGSPAIPGPTATSSPLTESSQPFSSLANMFMQAPQRRQQEDDQAAEQARKAALFGGLGALYG